MFDLKLFLGFAIDDHFQKELKIANPYLSSLFVGQTDYLQKVSFQSKTYLGKYLCALPTLEQIDLLEKHLLSLLLKLTPRYPFSSNPLCLVTLNG